MVGPGGRRHRPQHLDVGRKVQVVGEDPGPTGSGPEGRESRLVQADRRAVGQHHLAGRGTDQAGDLVADSPGQLKPAIVPPPDEPASPLDLEGFDHNNTACRESALSFLSGWTQKLHALDYVSGVYSSVSSGIKALDDARVNRPDRFVLPDAIWLARWDGVANTSSSYIREDGWRPGGRVKQYRGGHDETWGGVRINIDSNFLDLGKGSTARPQGEMCGGTRVNWPSYEMLRPPRETKNGTVRPDPEKVAALQCLLKQRGYFDTAITGTYGGRVVNATKAWQRDHGFAEKDLWARTHWMSLLAAGSKTTTKYGSSGDAVRRLQRSLNAASPKAKVVVTGVYGAAVEKAVKDWQKRVGMSASGVVNAATWRKLQAGKRS